MTPQNSSELYHYGIKGMKWKSKKSTESRNNEQSGGSDKRTDYYKMDGDAEKNRANEHKKAVQSKHNAQATKKFKNKMELGASTLKMGLSVMRKNMESRAAKKKVKRKIEKFL